MPIFRPLMEKNDLGIHTQYVTNTIMKLMAMGVVTNKKKGFNNGKIICSNAIGDQDLYDLLDNNSVVEFHPSKYVNDPRIISKNRKMVAMNIGRKLISPARLQQMHWPSTIFQGSPELLTFSGALPCPKEANRSSCSPRHGVTTRKAASSPCCRTALSSFHAVRSSMSSPNTDR